MFDHVCLIMCRLLILQRFNYTILSDNTRMSRPKENQPRLHSNITDNNHVITMFNESSVMCTLSLMSKSVTISYDC